MRRNNDGLEEEQDERTPDRTKRAALERELHLQIDEAPTTADSYLVLADLLMNDGSSARAELITLQHAASSKVGRSKSKDEKLASKDSINELIARLGPRPPRYGDWSWYCGFVSHLRNIVDEDDEDAKDLRRYLADPSLRHLQALDLSIGGNQNILPEGIIEAIAHQPRLTLRSLTLKSYWRGGNAPPAGEIDLTPLWPMLPRLERLCVSARYVIIGSEAAAREAFKNLKTLEVDAEFDTRLLNQLDAPKLETLTLLEQPILGQPKLEKLKGVKITFTPFDEERYVQTGE